MKPLRLIILKALVAKKDNAACDGSACDSSVCEAPGCDCHDDHAMWSHVSGPNCVLHTARFCCNCGKMHLVDDNGFPIIRKSLAGPSVRQLLGLDFGTPIIKAADADASTHGVGNNSGKKHGDTSGPTERWITVHPNGDGHEGHPIKIVENHDGSWTVSGGAGGKLNGLRLTGVKSHAEYKEHAKKKAEEKRAKQAEEKAQKKQSLHEKHAATVRDEAAKAGQTLSEPQVQKEAARRAQLEHTESETKRADAVKEHQQQKHEHEKHLIESVAKAQGWQSHEYSLDNDALGRVREAAKQRIENEYPGASPDEFHERVEKAVERVQKLHHAKALSRAREVLDNARELVVAAHDGVTSDALGDVKIGDLVKETLGDGGKGYTVNLQKQALERGMDIPAAQAQAADLSWQGFVERNDGDLEKAAKDAQFVAKLHNGAAKAREQIKEIQQELGAAGEPLSHLASLDTLPKAQNVKEAAELLSKAKELDAQIKAAQQGAKEAKDTPDLETLPTTAVMQTGAQLSPEEAREQVLHDLDEVRRQKATEHLMALYNAQEATAPIRSHRLSGHNAFFSNVGHLAGVCAPDPLMADILGESATAHVMRRAFESTVGDDDAMREGLKNALAEHHIATQVGIANEAARDAEELFNAADNIEDIPLDSVDGLMAGLDQNERKLHLVRAGREKLGVAVGRLEAAAALNEAFMGKPRGEIQVALGAISLQDAIARAHALGLSDPDHRTFDGQVTHEGEYHIHNDGKNKILLLREKGLDTLAAQLAEDPHHLDRAKAMEEIKTGAQDENGWLPKGFSPRPELDVSGGDGLVIPDSSLQLDLAGASTPEETKQRVRDHIAQRIEAGQDPISIVQDLNTAAFRAAHVPGEVEPQFRSALAEIAPPFKREAGAKPEPGEHKAHQDALRETLQGHHADWLEGQVQSGKLSSAEASVHRQTLSHDWETRDLLYQVALQDPRLQHAFHDTGALDRHGKKAVRDYAYQHIFNLDPKKHTEPITPLSAEERKAWDGWQKLAGEHLDPYQAIQQHWKEKDESEGGGMFGPAEPHDFATLDLSDDRSVVDAARRHAQALGYTPERRVLDVKAGKYEDVVPELEETPERALSSAASDARRRIKAALRDHAHQNMFGAADVAGTGFNPENVHTAGQRWAEYVKDIGGEQRALRTVQEKMRGDFTARFAKGHKQWKGTDFQTVAVPLTHAQAHARASLSPEKRAALDAQKSSEQAKVRDRAGGKFAAEGEGAVASKLEAKEQAQLLGGALFGADETTTEKEKLDTHRLSMGAAAEGMVRSLLPRINLKRGTVAAGNINMSSGDAIKRQRAIKQVLAAKRHGLTLSAGCVHADTLIHDPVSGVTQRIHDWFEAGGAFHVTALDKNGQAVIAKASAPFIKGIDPMFEVVTQTGHKIIVTGGHRFLTPSGWERLEDLQAGSRVAVHSGGANSLPASSVIPQVVYMGLQASPVPDGTATQKRRFYPSGFQFHGQKALGREVSLLTDSVPQFVKRFAGAIRPAFVFEIVTTWPCVRRWPSFRYLPSSLWRYLQRYASSLPHSISDNGLLARASGEWNYERKLPDSQGGCQPSGRSYDAQPQKAAGSGLKPSQGQGDVLSRIRSLLRKDVWGHKSTHTHVCHSACLRSMRNFYHPADLRVVGQQASRFLRGSFALLQRSSAKAVKSPRRFCLPGSIAEFGRRVFQGEKLGHIASNSHGPMSANPLLCSHGAPCQAERQDSARCANGSNLARANGAQCLAEYSQTHMTSAAPLDSVDCQWDTIQSVVSLGTHVVYDIEVYEHHNYLAHGLWNHNSGKTAVSLGIHGELRAKNPNHRTLMAVPSAVQEQFASEAARFYDMTQPNAPMWHADSSASPEERRASYRHDSGYDVNVVTHQALRDDLNWALAQHKFGGDEDKAREYLQDAPEQERNQAIKAATEAQGWRHDMTTVDEGHGLLNRAGKENSAMANAIDGYTHDKEYHVPMSADPVKNDSSEAFDALRKVAPQRFVNDDHPLAAHPRTARPGIVTRGEFLRKYNVNTPAAMEALQKEMAPYHYAESIKPPVGKHERVHIEKLTPEQQSAYNRVLTTYRQAREARRRGTVDVQAMQALSPNSFAGAPATEHEAIARRLQGSLGMIRDSALDHVVNNHPNGAKMQRLEKLLRDKPPSEHPHLVFAHSLEAVDALHDHLKAKGYRVGKIKGSMNGAQKEEQKLKFSPQYDAKAKRFVTEPEYDILIASDCASTGANLQRASEVSHYDTPHTAMTYQQRGHRAHRTGQWRDVTVNHLSTDTKYERGRRERLEKKNALREGLTTPAELLDDSGLAHRIAKETDLARARTVGQAVDATQSAPRATLGVNNQGDGSDQDEYSHAA